MTGSGTGAAKMDRKTAERNRRIRMKNLCFKLTSLIPSERRTMSECSLTQQDQLDQACNYVKELKERVEQLKQRKESSSVTMGFHLPGQVEVRSLDSSLEVILVCALRTRFMFQEVVVILEEEGAEVVHASFNIMGDRIFHTIHCQALSSRIGLEPSRVNERLKQLVC